MKDSAPDLSIVVVTWNVAQLLRACLQSVDDALRESRLAGEVFVVDNASRDGTPDMLAGEFPQVCLIANATNVGFTKGNNLAIARCRGRHVLLLNPDTQVAPSSLGDMVDYLDNNAQVGVVGPRLLFPDGSLQSSRRRFPTFGTALLESTILQRFFPNHPTLQHYYVADRQPFDEQRVDWLVGACLMVRHAALNQVGLLDEGFFMYSEELDWCRRIKGAGWEVAYLPSARVVHHEGQSSDQNVLARHQHFHDSKVRYFRKYHGRWPAFAVRITVVLSFLAMLIEETVKYALVPGKRNRRRPRLVVLAAALRYHASRIHFGGD